MIFEVGTKLFSLARVLDARLEASLRDTDTTPRYTVTTEIERRREHVSETKTLAADEVLLRNATILQIHLSQHRGPRSQHSKNRFGREPRSFSFDEERRRLALATREDQKHIGDLSETDPFLPAIQNIKIADTVCLCLDTLRIAANVWFRQ